MTIQVGYSITKTALKALTEEQRVDKYARHVDLGDRYRWFTFVASSSAIPDDINILMPNDEPETGRWIGDVAGSSPPLLGKMVCLDECSSIEPLSGKAFQFFAPQTDIELIVKPGFNIGISAENTNYEPPIDNGIQIHRWTQEPNHDMNGRVFVAELPHTGGAIKLSINNSSQNWISCFALDGGIFRATCFVVLGNVLVPIGFS